MRLVGLVVVLEMASGVPYGAVNDLVPMWLLQTQGISLASLGMLTLVGLPWTLKPLWAPIVDLLGTWQQWIGGAGLMTAGLLLAFSGAEPGWVVPMLVALAFASATQDIAVDGYLVARVPPTEHGRVNGVRVAAYRSAMALVGGALVLPAWIGWPATFLVVGAVQVALVAFNASTAPAPRATDRSPMRFLEGLSLWVSDPRLWPVFAFFLLFKLGDSAMAPMVKPFLLTRMSLGEVGLLSTTAGAGLVAVGALLGGEVVSRFGLARGVLALGALQAASNGIYAAAAAFGGVSAAIFASVSESLTGGLGTAGVMAVAMRGARGVQGATRFAVLSAIIGLTRTLSGATSGIAVEHVGYAGWFAITAAIAVPGLFLVRPAARALPGDDA